MKLTKLELLFYRIPPDYDWHIEFAGKILLHGSAQEDDKFVLETIGTEDYWITSLETYSAIKKELEKELNEQIQPR